jgi:hypothetical protein
MKVGDGGDVPRITCHGARQEGVLIVNVVGDNQFHEHFGNLVIGDGCALDTPWGYSQNELILALVRFQSWLASSSIAALVLNKVAELGVQMSRLPSSLFLSYERPVKLGVPPCGSLQ